MIGPTPTTWEVDAADVRARPVAPGIWRLRLPSPYWHIDHSNAYAIEGTDGLTLVDCGSGGHPSGREALRLALTETGHAIEDVRRLVITHHHSDHLGTAAWVVERSGCRVWMHPSVQHFTDASRHPARVRDCRQRRARAEGVPDALLDAYASVREEQRSLDGAVTADVDAIDGVRVPSGVGVWEVVETPGHAPSHIGLHLPEQRLLISADLVFAGFAPYYDYGYTPDPVAEFIASLERVAAMDLETAMPGHGRPMTRDELARALAEHRSGVDRRLDEVRAALTAGPRSAYEIECAVFPDTAGTDRGAWKLVEVLGYLRHLRLRGEVVRDVTPAGHRHRLA